MKLFRAPGKLKTPSFQKVQFSFLEDGVTIGYEPVANIIGVSKLKLLRSESVRQDD